MKTNNYKKMSFPKFVVGNLPFSRLLLKEEKQPNLMKKVEDPRQKHSGMTTNFNNQAFTLIELLVVVLIIGILAAVALPQYQKAVDKARFMKLLTPVDSISKAIDAYYLANGTFPTQWDELGITLPGTVDSTGKYLYNENSSLGLSYQGVYVWDNAMPGLTLYRFSDYRTDRFAGKIACYAQTDNPRALALCKNLSGKTTPDETVSYGNQLVYFMN